VLVGDRFDRDVRLGLHDLRIGRDRFVITAGR